ncbi:MAG: hypothetical protein WAK13_07220 [Terriglobales bacterium]
MATDYFALVDRIVEERKYFDISRSELVLLLEAKGEADIETEHQTTDDYANSCSVVLRLNIHCKHPKYVEGWTIALKLHNTRIDGLDFELKYTGGDGALHSGWHRHIWDHRLQSAEKNKVPAQDLNGIGSREEFLIRALKFFRIDLNATDYGTDSLPFA